MGLRPSELISIFGQENVSPAEMYTLWDKESSLGTAEGAKNDFQITKNAFNEVLPGGDYNSPTDIAKAAARYYAKYRDAQGGNQFAGFAAYNGGPGWQQTMQDKNALATQMAANAGKTPVDYASDAMTKYKAYSVHLPGTVEGEQPTYAAPSPSAVKYPSEQFLPTKPDPQAVIDDMYAQLQTAVKAGQRGLENFSAFTDTYTKSISELSNSIASKTEAAGAADAGVVKAKFAVDSKLASEAATSLSNAGVNTSDMMSMAADTLARMRGFKDRATELRSQIQAQQVDFLEDPVKWIENLVTLGPMIRRHNDAIDNYATEKNQLDGLVQSASALNETQNAKRAMLAGDVASGTANALELHASVKADEARMNAQQHNWQIRNAELQKTDANIRLLTAQSELLIRSKVLEEQQQGKELKQQADALSLQQYNTGLGAIGIRINSLDDYKRLPPAMKSVYEYLSQQGKFGPDFKGSMESIAIGNPSKMPSTTTSVLPLAMVAADAARVEQGKPMNLALSVAEQRTLFNRTAEAEAMKWQNDVYRQTERVSNPYKSPDVKTMLSDPNVAQLKIGQLLQRQVTENPGVPIDDKMVVDLVRAEFTKGSTYTRIEDATNDLVLYYKAAVAANNKAHNFYGMNLPVQDRYRFSPSNGKPIDFTSYQDAMRYMAKRAVQDITEAQPTFESIVP